MELLYVAVSKEIFRKLSFTEGADSLFRVMGLDLVLRQLRLVLECFTAKGALMLPHHHLR